MTGKRFLRDVVDTDPPHFFAYRLDSEANWMAAFTLKIRRTGPRLLRIGSAFWPTRCR